MSHADLLRFNFASLRCHLVRDNAFSSASVKLTEFPLLSAYNDPNPRGLQSYLNLISQRAKIEGVSFYRRTLARVLSIDRRLFPPVHRL